MVICYCLWEALRIDRLLNRIYEGRGKLGAYLPTVNGRVYEKRFIGEAWTCLCHHADKLFVKQYGTSFSFLCGGVFFFTFNFLFLSYFLHE